MDRVNSSRLTRSRMSIILFLPRSYYIYIYNPYRERSIESPSGVWRRTHLFENVLVRGRRRAGNRLLVFNRQTILVRFHLGRIRKLVCTRRQRLINLPLLLLVFHAVAATIAGTARFQHLRETELERRQLDEFLRSRGLRKGWRSCFHLRINREMGFSSRSHFASNGRTRGFMWL